MENEINEVKVFDEKENYKYKIIQQRTNLVKFVSLQLIYIILIIYLS